MGDESGNDALELGADAELEVPVRSIGLAPLRAAKLVGLLAGAAALASLAVVVLHWHFILEHSSAKYADWYGLARSWGVSSTLGLTVLALLLSRTWGYRASAVRVGPTGLRLVGGSSTVFPVQNIRSVMLTPQKREEVVHFALRSGNTLRMRVEREALAEDILDEIGLSPEQRRLRIVLGTVANRVSAGCGCGCFTVVGTTILFLAAASSWTKIPAEAFLAVWVVGTLALLRWIVRLTTTEVVEVGRDGVLVPGSLSPTFLPYADIRKVKRKKDNVRFMLSKGPPIELNVIDDDRRKSVFRAVHRARRAFRDEHSERYRLLDRGGRSLQEWQSRLARAHGRGSEYRALTLSEEELLAALTSGAAIPEQKIGAALALLASGDEHRAAVERAAATTANPLLREALESIAAGTPDEAKLDQLTDEEPEEE